MLIESPVVSCDAPLAFNAIGYDWPQHAVDRHLQGDQHYNWLQTLAGSGTVQIDGQTIQLAPNQGILLHPGVGYTYTPAAGGWRTAFLSFSGTLAPQLSAQLGLTHYLMFPELTGELADYLHAKLDAFTQDTPEARLNQSTAVFRFLLLLKQNVHAIHAFYAQSLYEPIVDYITKHYQEPLTNTKLCTITGYSAPYQTKLFRDYYGVTPLQYLNAFRLHKAKAMLLAHQDWQVQQIAAACGFSDISRFIHDFKALTGFTPLKYRRSRQFG
ncbi:AraC family transcriptional regulator [Lacticaseibacillus jixiensis]|uniref:AraC family transcriptional regulator n=1 Tax=Lacticaseibacillus jixiensis TaxID=3231926 RepID=UPI0036F26842